MYQAHSSKRFWILAGIAATVLTGAAVGAFVFFLFFETIPHGSSPSVPAEHCPEPRVSVSAGLLRGLCRPAVAGRAQYAAFLGVPYAQPPLGELRFRAPRPAQSWEGERDATRFGPRCLQGPSDPREIPLGDEDCLYVNVYTPWQQQQHADTELLPVLVHVHGGSNNYGTGNIIRPDYFVSNGLVVVTFNYRLNHFGFLNLDNDLAPGNAGFKDMVAALQWVKQNVRHFGGDPDKVTIQGCSSAAGAVHWLTLLPATEGLFRAAIVKSGSALASWDYSEHHRDVSDGALAFLRRLSPPGATDAALLRETAWPLLRLAFTYADRHRDKSSPESYADPTVSLERRPDDALEPRLILADAETYLLGGVPGVPTRSRVPLLIGFTNCEYDHIADMLFVLGELPAVQDNSMLPLMPRNAIPTAAARQALSLGAAYTFSYSDVLADLRAGVFNISALDANCDLRCRWDNFVSVTSFKMDTARALRMDTRRGDAPVYAYFYEYPLDGTCASHSRDDKLVWPEDEDLLMQLNTTNPLSLNVLRQVTLFTNFVKQGRPVLKTDPTVLTSEWIPMNNKNEEDIFLRIGKNLTMDKGDIVDKFGSYWTNLYKKYRENKGI